MDTDMHTDMGMVLQKQRHLTVVPKDAALRQKKQQQIMDTDMDTGMVLQKQRQRHLTVVPKDAALLQKKQQQIMDTDMDMVHKPSLLHRLPTAQRDAARKKKSRLPSHSLLHRLPTAQRDAARKKMSRLLSQCWLSVSVVSSTSLSQLTQSSYLMEWCRHRSMETT